LWNGIHCLRAGCCSGFLQTWYWMFRLTFKDRHTATLQMLYFIYSFNNYKYWVF
jgi:hypothetical protein